MAHLGDDVSALVDGQLPPERAEAAHAHLVTCRACADLVARERASRRRLAAAKDVEPSQELTSRLMRLAHDGVPPHAQGAWAVAGRAWAPLHDGRIRRRLAQRTTLAAAGLVVVAAALVVVGTIAERTGDPASMLAGASGADRDESEMVMSAQTVRLTSGRAAGLTAASLEWLRSHGWSAPESLPEGARITAVGTTMSRAGEQLLEMEVVDDGKVVDVVQQRAVLDPDGLGELTPVELGGHQAYLLPGETAVVLQSDEVTVLVSSPGDPSLALDVARGFPVTGPGSDLADRLDRGWHTVVGWTDLLVETS